MDYLSLAYNYGTLEYVAVVNDSLTRIVRKLYNSDGSLYYNSILALNDRMDWDNVKVGAVIHYLNADVFSV